jgi:hypothetical protein
MPIGKLMEVANAGTPIIQYKVKTNHLELLTYEMTDFVWMKDDEGNESRVINRKLADAIRERCTP